MVTTRRSNGSQSSPNGSEASSQSATKTNRKRAADTASSPSAKTGKTEKPAKKQKTIEETLDVDNVDMQQTKDKIVDENGNEQNDQTSDEVMIERGDIDEDEDIKNEINGDTQQKNDAKGTDAKETDSKTNGHTEPKKGQQNGQKEGEKNALDEVKADETEVKKAAKAEETEKAEQIASNNDSVIEDEKREASIPSSILEKGIIYFFFRSRVNVEEPQGVEDVARSYIVLRPLPIGAKLGEGPLEDAGNARLLALPKKVLPKSKQDRFLVFVEKAKATVNELKETFISASDYATKTVGTSHTPAATPIAEGVYTISSTGRESHLAYHITIPELGEIQKELGLNEKGSYVVSAKNPKYPGPANASLSKGAEYPEAIMKDFRDLHWMPLKPELLEYENTQFLIIGEGMGNVDAAMQEMSKDEKDDTKETPAEEMEKLEDEDQIRVEHLKGDDAIFADLGLSSKEYPKLQTTW